MSKKKLQKGFISEFFRNQCIGTAQTHASLFYESKTLEAQSPQETNLVDSSELPSDEALAEAWGLVPTMIQATFGYIPENFLQPIIKIPKFD